MNGFFASVELLDRPDLVDKPMAVCGDPESRHGIILAKNEIAKKYGIVTAETIWQAKKKCPELVTVPPHRDKYTYYSHEINQIYLEYTDMVEPFSIDESWLDVTASQKLFGTGRQIADQIRERVKTQFGLTLSAGVSYNKIFAKMGSEYKKPDATTEITRENYKDILWPQPAGDMFFVGKATAAKLYSSLGIKTIGDIANTSPESLRALLGKQGDVLYRYVNGLDEEPVHLYTHREPIKSVGNGMTFRRNLVGEDDILSALAGLCDTVASRLRKYHLKGCGIKVDIKDPTFRTISRQKQLDAPTNLATEIKRAAMELILASWSMTSPIRLLTVTAINLVDENYTQQQISLFDMDDSMHKKDESLELALDSIRNKFGKTSVGFGRKTDI